MTTDIEQPYVYRRHELVEPDWTRLPGYRDVTAEQWADAQWQRVNCVKNAKQLRDLMGDLLSDEFYADLERDQAERATMSMLIPPQMMNTMVSEMTWADGRMPAAGADFTAAFLADPVRRSISLSFARSLSPPLSAIWCATGLLRDWAAGRRRTGSAAAAR